MSEATPLLHHNIDNSINVSSVSFMVVNARNDAFFNESRVKGIYNAATSLGGARTDQTLRRRYAYSCTELRCLVGSILSANRHLEISALRFQIDLLMFLLLNY